MRNGNTFNFWVIIGHFGPHYWSFWPFRVLVYSFDILSVVVAIYLSVPTIKKNDDSFPFRHDFYCPKTVRNKLVSFVITDHDTTFQSYKTLFTIR